MNSSSIGYEKRDLYIKIAKMYFVEELSQQEISDRVQLSRSNISKILKTCRKLNIVEIKVNDTSSLGLRFQHEIEEQFNVKQVIVIPTDKNKEETKIQVGKAAAGVLSTLIHDNVKIGISRGSTLFHVIDQFSSSHIAGGEVVQMVGGTGFFNMRTDGHELTRILAHKINAESSVLQAPLLVRNKNLQQLLIAEPGIAEILRRAEHTDIAVMGLGTNHVESSAFFRFGYMTEEESIHMLSLGAVGDICGRQIDIEGNEFKTELNDRVIGIELEKVKNIPVKVCVAEGAHKAEVIVGALRGGFIDHLIIDEDAAMNVINLIKKID